MMVCEREGSGSSLPFPNIKFLVKAEAPKLYFFSSASLNIVALPYTLPKPMKEFISLEKESVAAFSEVNQTAPAIIKGG